MGVWLDEAKMAAARRAGRRWWKWLLVAHLLRVAAPGLLAVTGIATIALLAWHTARSSFTAPQLATLPDTAVAAEGMEWPVLLRLAALAAALVWAGWTARDLLTGAAIRRRQARERQPVPALALGAALALLVASLLIR